MQETFTLEGVTYSQQYRKCGKTNCQTCQGGGAGHGPYWYRRDQVSGARSYVGRELPAGVAAARQEIDRQRQELALTALACAVAIPAVVWYYEVRGHGKENDQ